MKKILIIGNSAAGTSAAASIREFDKEARITIVSREQFPAYERHKILDYLEGKLKEKDLFFRNQDFYSKNSIELFLDSEVSELNLNRKKAMFKNRDSIEFDFLVIASGAKVKLPVIKGIQKEGVLAFGDLSSVKFLIENLPIAHTVIIVGSDTIAKRIARIVASKKIEVKLFGTSVEPTEGVEVISDNPIMEILGDSEVKAVRLANNKVIGASIIVFCQPRSAAVDFLKDSGVNIGQSILVDAQMRTNYPFVFAIGDCAESADRTLAQDWDSALKCGANLGSILCQM